MRARSLADLLAAAGVPSSVFTEPSDMVDGCVQVSASVHIQVPFPPGSPNVVRETRDGHFVFFPPRQSFVLLLSDLRSAIADSRGA